MLVVEQIKKFRDNNDNIIGYRLRDFTPNGTKIHQIGLTPDYEVELPDVKEEKDFVDTQLNKAKELLK